MRNRQKLASGVVRESKFLSPNQSNRMVDEFIDVVPGLCTVRRYPKGSSLRRYLPFYLSKIQSHYESSATTKSTNISDLSPRDFYDKWNSDGSRKDQEPEPEPSSVIMKIAPSVVSVSLFTGVQRKVDCSGLIIQWDDSNDKATILTSAKVIRIPEACERDDFYIVVRLSNGKILLAEEDYVDYYHNIITLKVSSDAKLKPIEMPPVDVEIAEGIEVVALGRDFYTCSLSESNGIIHKDYPYFGCELLASSTCVGTRVGEGGPLITRMGDVCGINFFDGHQCVHPLPIRVIWSYLEKWTSNGIVVQPWFGLTVIDIAELPRDALKTIAVLYPLTSAVVKQVHEGSPADKLGVRPGDSVFALNEIPLKSASEYSLMLGGISGILNASLYKTPNITMASVRLNVSHNNEIFVVHAENLTVDDKRFCCSWPGNESDWYRDPLFGSQKDFPYDMW